MKTDRDRLSERPELALEAQPQALRLVDLVQAVRAFARNDAEIAAVLEYMLHEGHLRLAQLEALAA
jgi:hypothetical protein